MHESPSELELEAERGHGARARAASLSTDINPHFAKERLPAATGESVGAWSLKAEAWEDGWWAEDDRMMTTPKPY